MTAASLNIIKSSPITASRATDKPPSVCSEPSVVLVAAVVSSVLIIPLAVNAAEVKAPAITPVPETSRLAFTSTRVALSSISSVAFISKIALLGAFIY